MILGVLAIFSIVLQSEVWDCVKNLNAHRAVILISAIFSYFILFYNEKDDTGQDRASLIVVCVFLTAGFILSFLVTAYNPKKFYKEWEEETRLKFTREIQLEMYHAAERDATEKRESSGKLNKDKEYLLNSEYSFFIIMICRKVSNDFQKIAELSIVF